MAPKGKFASQDLEERRKGCPALFDGVSRLYKLGKDLDQSGTVLTFFRSTADWYRRLDVVVLAGIRSTGSVGDPSAGGS